MTESDKSPGSTPDLDAPAEAEASALAASPVETDTSAEISSPADVARAVEPEVKQEPPRLAPDAPRLGTPSGAAKRVADPVSSPPSTLFLLVVSVVSLVADVGTKLWAEAKLEDYPGYIDVIDGHLQFVLAKNKGGAWGLLGGADESLRRPFFLLVSVAAISFIVTLYRKLSPRQHALKWGLPLVLGGALGNVFDRVRYGHVIDFIDYRAEWVRSLNELVAKYSHGHWVTDHWPTFNIADVAICIGVVLMAVDMFTSKRPAPERGADVPVVRVVPAAPRDDEAGSEAH